ncbi:MAG: hypothetical protein ACKO0M_12150, partial [Cyanobium sp.]
TINLGDGNDTLNAQSTGGAYDYSYSTVDASSGDDIVYAYTPSDSTFIGGSGKDTLIFSGLINNWSIVRSKDTFGRSYVAVGGNKVYGFETIRFEQPDPSGLLYQTISGGVDVVDPLAPWRGKATMDGDSINEQALKLQALPDGSQLVGSAYGDALTGGNANDVLIGMRGTDSLTGNLGADLFVLRRQDWFENDRLIDFTAKVDKILLAEIDPGSTLFSRLSSRKLAKKALLTSADDNKALLSSAELVYSKVTGNLYYNPNGTALGLGSGGGLIAILPTGLTLSGADVLVSATQPC